jgi:hypothetical protein
MYNADVPIKKLIGCVITVEVLQNKGAVVAENLLM